MKNKQKNFGNIIRETIITEQYLQEEQTNFNKENQEEKMQNKRNKWLNNLPI